MKVLGLIGRSAGPASSTAGRETFQYMRKDTQIVIDITMSGNPKTCFYIPASRWENFLVHLNGLGGQIVTLHGTLYGANGSVPSINLINEIQLFFNPEFQKAGVASQDYAPCIAAILFNEGTIELYHGLGGFGQGISIPFHKS